MGSDRVRFSRLGVSGFTMASGCMCNWVCAWAGSGFQMSLFGDVGRQVLVSRLTIFGRERGCVSVFLVCRSYDGSTGVASIGLVMCGGWSNIGGSLDSVGVGGG